MRQLTEMQQQWLFDLSAWDHTPSRQEGMSYDEELVKRTTVVRSIQSLALRCHLYDLVVLSALTVGAQRKLQRKISDAS